MTSDPSKPANPDPIVDLLTRAPFEKAVTDMFARTFEALGKDLETIRQSQGASPQLTEMTNAMIELLKSRVEASMKQR